MRQIVTGLFETYDDARRAQDALLLKGFAVTDIELPVRGTTAETSAAARRASGMLAGIERLFASLFATDRTVSTPGASEYDARLTALRYALQRGAVLLGVWVFDDAHLALARETLTQQQALQVDEHAPDWQLAELAPEAEREHSALDELGISELATVIRKRTAWPAATDTNAAAASAPGTGGNGAASPVGAAANTAPRVPDEFLEYEEDFPGHHVNP